MQVLKRPLFNRPTQTTSTNLAGVIIRQAALGVRYFPAQGNPFRMRGTLGVKDGGFNVVGSRMSFLFRDVAFNVLRVACALGALCWLGGCQQQTVGPTVTPSAVFSAAGLLVQLQEPAELKNIRVEDVQGNLLAELPAAGRRSRFELPFRWQPGEKYRIFLNFKELQYSQELSAPAAQAALRPSLDIPLGQGETPLPQPGEAAGEKVVFVPAKGTLQLGLLVENDSQMLSQFAWRVEWPPEVSVSSEDDRITLRSQQCDWQGNLELDGDWLQTVLNVTLPDNDQPAKIKASFRQQPAGTSADKEQWQTITLVLRPLTPQALAELLELKRWTFPADPSGEEQPDQLTDSVVLPDEVWTAMRRLLRRPAQMFNHYDPYAQQAIDLHNHGNLPLNLRIESEICDLATGRPLLDFSPPIFKSPVESTTSEHLLRVEGQQTSSAVIPVYVRPGVRPGQYERRLRVYWLGSSQPVLQAVRPLVVIRGDPMVSAVVVCALVAGGLGWGGVLWGGRSVVQRVGVNGLSTIGLLAAVHFVAAYAFRLGSDILAGVLGPFYVFLAGLGNEGVSALMLAVVVTLVPRVGAASLSMATVFLLYSMFTGQFGFVDMLFLSVGCVANETLLALSGVTTTQRFRQPAETLPLHAVVRLALALGSAKALTLYTQLCLYQVVYRLYYADWYILAVTLWVGLGYGTLGAACGAVLGSQLRRTAR